MLKLFICLLILTTTSAAIADGYGQNPYPYNSFPRQISRYDNEYGGFYNFPKEDLNAIEKYALKKCYPRENCLDRIERLEDLAFGAIQNGDLETRYNNVKSAILSKPQCNYRQSLLNNIANYFIGQTTGYTPSFTPEVTSRFTPEFMQILDPNSGDRKIEQFSNGIFGNRYKFSDSGVGSGATVRILD